MLLCYLARGCFLCFSFLFFLYDFLRKQFFYDVIIRLYVAIVFLKGIPHTVETEIEEKIIILHNNVNFVIEFTNKTSEELKQKIKIIIKLSIKLIMKIIKSAENYLYVTLCLLFFFLPRYWLQSFNFLGSYLQTVFRLSTVPWTKSPIRYFLPIKLS